MGLSSHSGQVRGNRNLGRLAALLARELREWVRALCGRDGLAEAVAWTFALSPPLLFYAGLIFTEVPAALAVAFGLRRGRESALGPGGALAIGLAAAALPWLNVRYVPLAALVVLHALWHQRRLRSAVALAVPLLGWALLARPRTVADAARDNLLLGIDLPSSSGARRRPRLGGLVRGLTPRGTLARLDRLRLADAEPMSIEESYLVHRYCPSVLQGDYVSNSLRVALERDYGIRWAHARQVIRAILTPPHLADSLSIGSRSAMLFIERVSYSQENIPVEFLRIYYRADRYTLHNELSG